MASYIAEHFVPVSIHIKEQPVQFRRFGAIWTPTVLVLDSEGVERWRIEGYLPRPEFHAQLALARGRIAATHKRWKDAEALYQEVLDEHAGTTAVPEAIYWHGVSQYQQSHDHTGLGQVTKDLAGYPESIWALKSVVWGG